jgi:hypothetical protein
MFDPVDATIVLAPASNFGSLVKMSDGNTQWLLDLRPLHGRVDAGQVRTLLATCPGVLGVHVSPEVQQAEVVLDQVMPHFPDEAVVRLMSAGYWVKVSQVPPPLADSDYARYYYASSDSAPGRWVD